MMTTEHRSEQPDAQVMRAVVIRALAAFLWAGFLAGGTCQVKACSGNCKDHEHGNEESSTAERITAHEMLARGTPPGETTRWLTRIRGPRLSPEDREQERLREDFARRILHANHELLGLGTFVELALETRLVDDALLIESDLRDAAGSSRVTLRIDRDGRLSAVRVQRTALGHSARQGRPGTSSGSAGGARIDVQRRVDDA